LRATLSIKPERHRNPIVFDFVKPVIERLEVEARRLAGLAADGPAASASRKQTVR
jgi:hypothetical protein